jgi:hypothetical protein
MTEPAALAALALQEVAKVVAKLTPEQLADLAEGRAHVEYRSGDTVVTSGRARSAGGPAKASSVDIPQVVKLIGSMTSRDEVLAYLQSRTEFKVADLREIARALGPTVSATGRKRDDLIRNIAEGTAGFRQGSAAVLGGSWRQ